MSLIGPEDTIVIDVGTIALEVARALPASFRGRVLTNSLPAAMALADREQIEIQICGGQLRLTGRALVVGAEHVSFSAAVTLAHAGARVVALITEFDRQRSYAAFRLGAALRWRVPVRTSTAVHRVAGRGRLAGVEVADVRTGATRFVPCETRLETSAAGVFAAGNLIHAAETADIAALSGRHAARHIAAGLGARSSGEESWAGSRPSRRPVLVEPPLRWISPNAIGFAVAPPPGRFVLRSGEFRRGVRLEARQDGQLLARSRQVRLVPGRPVHLDAGWLALVNPEGGPVRVAAAR